MKTHECLCLDAGANGKREHFGTLAHLKNRVQPGNTWHIVSCQNHLDAYLKIGWQYELQKYELGAILKPSKKFLRLHPKAIRPTERFIVVGERTALLYDSATREAVPFPVDRKHDSFVTRVKGETIPKLWYASVPFPVHTSLVKEFKIERRENITNSLYRHLAEDIVAGRVKHYGEK